MKLYAFDVETSGALPEYALQPWRLSRGEAWITAAAVATDDDYAMSLRPDASTLGAFLRRAADERAYVTGWNTAFDVAWLIALGLREEVMRVKWLDGLLLWRHLTSAPEFTRLAPRSYSLKEAVRVFFPANAGYETDVDFHATEDEAALRRLRDYNQQDALFTHALTRLFLGQKPASSAVLPEAAAIPLVADSVVAGIWIDRAAVEALRHHLVRQQSSAYAYLALHDVVGSPKELNSPAKLQAVLFDKLRLPAVKITAKGARSTDKATLKELAIDHPIADKVLQYREARGNLTKFADNTLASLDYNSDGRVHPVPRMFSTYTGRMTYSSKQGKGKDTRQTGVALHQWKRDAAYRRQIVAPEGYTMAEFDFAGQEYRWMAVFSGDVTMLSLCEPGQDAHSYMGAAIHGVDYAHLLRLAAEGDKEAKARRLVGKVANLSLQYRTGANRLREVAFAQHALRLSHGEAERIWSQYRKTYRRVPLYWRAQVRVGKSRGYVETYAKRRIFVGESRLWSAEEDYTWSRESTCINAPIQGSGADQKYLALAALRVYLPQVEGRFYFELHDGLFVVLPDRYAERAVRQIKHMLSNLPYKKAWGVEPPIQFPVDAKMGKSWGELKEVVD